MTSCREVRRLPFGTEVEDQQAMGPRDGKSLLQVRTEQGGDEQEVNHDPGPRITQSADLMAATDSG